MSDQPHKQLLSAVASIMEAQRKATEEGLGSKKALVTSAVILDANEKELVEKKVASLMGTVGEIEYRLDESVLSGVRIQIDDYLFDSTAKTQLARLVAQLKGNL